VLIVVQDWCIIQDYQTLKHQMNIEYCTDDFEKPKMFSIRRNQVEDPLETVEIEITQLQKKIITAK